MDKTAKLLGPFQEWAEAFATAKKLLAENQLDAITIVSEDEFRKRNFTATVLNEFPPAEIALERQRIIAHELYGHRDGELFYQEMHVIHPFLLDGEAKLLIMVYS